MGGVEAFSSLLLCMAHNLMIIFCSSSYVALLATQLYLLNGWAANVANGGWLWYKTVHCLVCLVGGVKDFHSLLIRMEQCWLCLTTYTNLQLYDFKIPNRNCIYHCKNTKFITVNFIKSLKICKTQVTSHKTLSCLRNFQSLSLISILVESYFEQCGTAHA